MSTPIPEISSIQGSEPYELKDSRGTTIGVNGAFVWKQFQEIERTKTISDISTFLFNVHDPNTLNLTTMNKRQVLISMLMNHVLALHEARGTDGRPEFESSLVDKYKWIMKLNLQNDLDAKTAFENFKSLVGADSSNIVLDWNTFVGNMKNPVEFAKLYKNPVLGPLKGTNSQPGQSGGSLTVFWTRHALSCANVLKDLGERRKRSSLAPNSSIADIGIEQCRQFKDQIQAIVPRDLDFVGASALLRAQQTAALLYNPDKVYVLPYISEKRTLLPDDDNQPMTEAKNTDMFVKFKEYMERKYTVDVDNATVRSELHYTFMDMFVMNEKEAFKVKADPMLILPKIYETLLAKNKESGKNDFTIAIVSHQGWLRDAMITSEKVMNCAVVKQVFTIDGTKNLKEKETEIVFPKKGEIPFITLDGRKFTFTPSINPSLKDIFNGDTSKSLSENDYTTYVGICEFMQKNYISEMQKSPARTFFAKTLKKGHNVGKKAANVARKVGQQTKKRTHAVLSKLSTYVAPNVNTSGNFFGLESSKKEQNAMSGHNNEFTNEEQTEIIPGVLRKNFSRKNRATQILKERMAEVKSYRENQYMQNMEKYQELSQKNVADRSENEVNELLNTMQRLTEYKEKTGHIKTLAEGLRDEHGINIISKK